MSDTTERVDALEMKISYVEKAIADLDGLVYEYGRRMERLERAMKSMGSKMAELGVDSGSAMGADVKPPHY